MAVESKEMTDTFIFNLSLILALFTSMVTGWIIEWLKCGNKDRRLWKKQKRGEFYNTLVSRYTEEDRESLKEILRKLDWSVQEENYKTFKMLVRRVNVLDWANFQRTLSVDISKIPLLINDKNSYIRKIAVWRIGVGK